MDTTSGRCGPLCQHPGCWESDIKKPFRHKHPQYEKYVDQLLRQRCVPSKPGQHRETENDGLPVLKVQTVALEIDGGQRNAKHSPANTTPSPAARTAACSLRQPPRLRNVEVLLEAAKFSPSSTSLSVSPVLIWRPGRPAHRPRATAQSRVQENVAVKNLTDALPAERPDFCSADKVKSNSRSHSRADSRPDSLDILHDVPHYLIAEILHQLQSERSSPPSPSPHDHISTHQSTAARPDSCHVPCSLICDLSTGQFYRNTPPNVPATTSSRDLNTSTSPPPVSPTSHVSEAPNLNPKMKTRKRRVTPPSVSKKTSFSRALSQAPMTVLHRTQTLAPTSHPRLTLTTLILPPNPPQRSHPISSHRHTTRYPLGNLIVPRTPQTHNLNPLLAPYPSPPSHPPQITNRFLHILPADFHNARLVTLHCSSNLLPDNHPAIDEESTPEKEHDGDTVHLPPILSPSPLPCVSPDHMDLGAEIVGNQLVLDRGGEHVVHPLTDSASRPETTPSSGGMVNGTQPPPPTAN